MNSKMSYGPLVSYYSEKDVMKLNECNCEGKL